MVTLTLGKLVRAVDIVAPHNYSGDFEGFPIRMYQHLRGRLAGSVWVRWCENAALQQVVVIVFSLAIYLVWA
jgi:hypothetical protein